MLISIQTTSVTNTVTTLIFTGRYFTNFTKRLAIRENVVAISYFKWPYIDTDS